MTDFPLIYLLNLDRDAERLRLFHRCNGHLTNIVRVSATDGSTLDRQALIDSGYLKPDLPYATGTLGCAMSHIKLWELAAAEGRSITIFEDDIAVSYHFEKQARDLLSALPADWDTIHWGFLLNPLYVWIDLGDSKVRLDHYGPRRFDGIEGIKQFQTEENVPGAVRLLHVFGTQGYSISAKGARAALQYCLPLRNRMIEFPEAGVITPDVGIDIVLCGLYPALKAFLCMPQLVLHLAHESVRKAINEELAASGV